MVTTQTRRSPAWALAAEVPDPEIPVVTIGDLGILRDVAEDDRGGVHVQVTPTYSGCPAMDAIADDLVERLTAAGYQHVDVEFVLSPAWTTDEWAPDEATINPRVRSCAPSARCRQSHRAAISALRLPPVPPLTNTPPAPAGRPTRSAIHRRASFSA